MLDEKDLQILQAMMETVVDTRVVQIEKSIDVRVAQTEKLIDARVAQTENLLLDELSRTRSILEKKIETVQKNTEELSQYYRITKLESDNTSLLLQMINDLRKEFEELRQKIA